MKSKLNMQVCSMGKSIGICIEGKSSTTALRTKPQVILIEKSAHNSYYVHQRAEDSCDMSLNGQNTVVMCPSSVRA